MSDTPRTDAHVGQPCMGGYVSIDFARRLERELAVVTKERDELARGFANLDSESVYMKLVGERDSLRQQLRTAIHAARK